MTTPVIIDTDPGIDDAVAIMLALASPELRVLGLTSVGGNSGIEHTTENARRLLHLLGRDDLPVGVGAAAPLARLGARSAAEVHGEDGFGGVVLDPAPAPDREVGAVDLLVELVESSPDPVTLVAIGPLTNVAVLAATHPDTYAKLERVVVMGGGARVLGNMTPTAEFNIWFDPEAAARVFASGVPVTMVGLDVTQRAVTMPDDWAQLRDGGPVGQALLGMVAYYTDFYRTWRGTEGIAQHDALAVASVIEPSLITTRHCHVDVECAGPLTRGMTVVDVDAVGTGTPNTHVALDLDAPAFTRLLVERITALDAAVR